MRQWTSDQRVQFLGEVAMLLMMVEAFIEKSGPGRLKARCVRLRKEIIKEMQKIKNVTEDEKNEASKKVIRFGEMTGWEGKPRHIVTHISFFLAMMEASFNAYSPKIYRLFNDIVDYFDRGRDHSVLCDHAGITALEKWASITCPLQCE